MSSKDNNKRQRGDAADDPNNIIKLNTNLELWKVDLGGVNIGPVVKLGNTYNNKGKSILSPLESGDIPKYDTSEFDFLLEEYIVHWYSDYVTNNGSEGDRSKMKKIEQESVGNYKKLVGRKFSYITSEGKYMGDRMTSSDIQILLHNPKGLGDYSLVEILALDRLVNEMDANGLLSGGIGQYPSTKRKSDALKDHPWPVGTKLPNDVRVLKQFEKGGRLIAFIDFEGTTKNGYTTEPWEVAVKLSSGEKFSALIKIGREKISKKVRDMCKLDADDLSEIEQAEPWNIVAAKLYAFLKENKKGHDSLVLAAYNGKGYDFPLLLRYDNVLSEKIEDIIDEKLDILDVVRDASVSWPNYNPTRKSLSEVYKACVDEEGFTAHRALGDAEASEKVLGVIDPEEMIQESHFYCEDEKSSPKNSGEVSVFGFKGSLLSLYIDHPQVIAAMYLLMILESKRNNTLRCAPAKHGLPSDGGHWYHTHRSCSPRLGFKYGSTERTSALAYAVLDGHYETMMNGNNTFQYPNDDEVYKYGREWVLSKRNHGSHLLCYSTENLPDVIDVGVDTRKRKGAQRCMALGHVCCADVYVNIVLHEMCRKRQVIITPSGSRYLSTECECSDSPGNPGRKACLWTKFTDAQNHYAKEKNDGTVLVYKTR